MTLVNNLEKLEEMSEKELEGMLKHILYKIEALANILKIDARSRDMLKRVLRYVLSINFLLIESQNTLEEDESDFEKSVAELKRIKSANLPKVEETLYLVRDIAREYYVCTAIT